MIPFIGSGVDKSADELQSGEYGKSLGHFVAAALPLFFGASEATPVTSEAEAAANASRQASIGTRTPVGVSSVRQGINKQFAKTPTGLNPTETIASTEPTATAPSTAPVERAIIPERSAIKGVPPASDANIAAEAFLRRNRAVIDPADRIISSEGRATGRLRTDIDPKTGLAKTTEISNAAAEHAATNADIEDYVRKQFGESAGDKIHASLVEEPTGEKGTPAERAALAHDTLARYAVENPDKIAPDAVSQLADIRSKLGITSKPTAEPKTAGTQPSGAMLDAIKQRANTSVNYSKDVGELTTKHNANISQGGQPAGGVNAVEENGSNLWIVKGAYSGAKAGAGSRAYGVLAENAQKAATERGTPLTLQGDAAITPQALRIWTDELPNNYKVDWSGKQGESRPSITFQPKATPKIDTSLPVSKSVAASSASEHFGRIGQANKAVDRAMPFEEDLSNWDSQQATNPK
jgi:hypothetical protein